MSDKKLSVAFIGTGIMGAPIAGHILDAGYPVTVYNRTKAKTDDLVSRGAVWADSPAAAAKDADVVFTFPRPRLRSSSPSWEILASSACIAAIS